MSFRAPSIDNSSRPKPEVEINDVAVIGGGISGLTVAHRLHRNGYSAVVLERQDRVGGVIQTELIDGYLCERGPNSVYVKPALANLIEELSLTPQRPSATSSTRYLTKFCNDGAEEIIPIRPGLFTLARSNIVSARAKARILFEPFREHRQVNDESVRSFFERRFGFEFTEHVIRPAMNGIFASDIDRLSIRSTFPALYENEQSERSLLLQAVRAPFQKRRAPRPYSASFQQGLAELPVALEFALPPGAVIKGRKVVRLDWKEDCWEIHHIVDEADERICRAHAIVLATPSYVTAQLLQTHLQQRAGNSDGPPSAECLALENIEYLPFGILHLSVPSGTVPHRGFGLLRAPKSGEELLGVVFASDLYPERARSGRSLYTCMVGGERALNNPSSCDVRHPDIQAQVINSFCKLFMTTTSPQIVSATFLYRAIPHFKVGHYSVEEAVRLLEATIPSLVISGNWIQGVSIADCVARGEVAAEQTISMLKQLDGSSVGFSENNGQPDKVQFNA